MSVKVGKVIKEKVPLYHGKEVEVNSIIGADGLLHYYGYDDSLCELSGIKLKGYDAKGLAEYLYDIMKLNLKYSIKKEIGVADEPLLRNAFIKIATQALEDIGFTEDNNQFEF